MKFLFCALILTLFATHVDASVGPGLLYGIVTDEHGVKLATATVVMVGCITENNAGAYKARFASDNTYTVTVSAPGYQTQTVKILLRAGTTLHRDFHLLPVVANG